MGSNHIARLDRPESFPRALAESVFERMYKFHQRNRSAAADVEQTVAVGGLPDQADHPFDDIVDIGKITLHAPVVKNVDDLIACDRPGKFVGRHIGPSPGSIHGEKTESRHGNPKQMVIRVGHQFIGFLGRGVEGNRVIHAIFHCEWELRIASVHGTRRRIKEMRRANSPAAFEYV